MPEDSYHVISQIVEELKKRITGVDMGHPMFKDPKYEAEKLDVKNFHQISKEKKTDRIICFIDGGSGEIVSSPNFAVSYQKLYFNLYRGREKLYTKKLPQILDYFVYCYTDVKKDGIYYNADFMVRKKEWLNLLPNISNLSFYSYDRTLMSGLTRAPINRIPNVIRHISEWVFASHVINNELEEGDILVKDGALQTLLTGEEAFANNAFNAAISKGVVFSALAKRSVLFTSKGYPLFAAINLLSKLSPYANSEWYYHPIVRINKETHRADMYAVKLNKSSDYVFRFEILKDQAEAMREEEIKSVISSLASNAVDAAFLGYPFGLIDADANARVSKDDVERMKLLFDMCVNAKGLNDIFTACIKTVDAHVTLNEVMGG